MARIACLVLSGLFAACGSATEESTTPGPRWQARSQAGLYRITIRPEQAGPRIGSLHAWIVAVESDAGSPVEAARLAFDGGMPEHGHGFETRPRITDALGDGLYRVDGIRFSMTGLWRLRVDVAAAEGVDFASFDVEVGP